MNEPKLIYKKPVFNNAFGFRKDGVTHIKPNDEVKEGDKVLDFRGESVTVQDFRFPHKSNSEGKVWVKNEGSTHSSEYYVSVIGAQWDKRPDRD